MGSSLALLICVVFFLGGVFVCFFGIHLLFICLFVYFVVGFYPVLHGLLAPNV